MTTSDILLIFNLFILESLLSVDNAAVLAVMVKDLPPKQQPRALKYGIAGAFIFRGVALFTAAWLVKIVWLKIAGGAYLLYLCYGHFTPKRDTIEEGVDKQHNRLFLWVSKSIGIFWATVVLVEFMDIAFSIDNIFAAVAMTSNLYVILLGVFIGIVSMRFVAQGFTVLMRRYPSLETSAFIVIALLGLKLVLSGCLDYTTSFAGVKAVMSHHVFDFVFSGVMMLIFFVPMIFKRKQALPEHIVHK